MSNVRHLEPWLDKHGLAAHLGCGVRWIEYRVRDGLPSAIIAGKRKFRASEAERWLEREGYLVREGAA